MDSTTLDFALMAGEAYFDKRKSVNRIPIPTGATLIDSRALASGYEARAYNYGGKIVISIAGTYFPDQFLGRLGSGTVTPTDSAGLKDMATNVNLFAGGLDQQLKDAAVFYADIVKNNLGKEVVFTGHSLGGGLASLMAVFFDKQAIAFDPAPFRNAATEANSLLLRDYLTSKGYPVDAKLNSFTATQRPLGVAFPEVIPGLLAASAVSGGFAAALAAFPVPVTIRGESNIKIVATAGEFLTGNDFSDFRNRLRIGTGGSELVTHGSLGKLDPIAAHSQSLLYLLGESTAFRDLTTKLPDLLTLLSDSRLYAHATDTPTRSIIEHLLRQELGAGLSGAQATTNSTGFLDKFVADLGRTTTPGGVTARADWQKALTVAAMDYYYNKEASTATQFFKLESGGLHFNLDDIGVSTLKSQPLLRTAASSTAIGGDPFNLGNVGSAKGWHVQTGEGAMNWAASKDADDVAIGGAQADVLRAGAGSDYVVGGAGDDTLDGGVGYDTLLGGEGNDTYDFKTGEINDTITDSDGTGRIMVNGIQLTGGKKKDDNYWVSDDKQWGYLLTTGGDLIVTRGSSTDKIVVQNWQGALGNKLGLDLQDAPAAPPPGPGVYSYPGHAEGDWLEFADWGGGVTQLSIDGHGPYDRLDFATLAGNDMLGGFINADKLDGGAGDDVIFGGLGADQIKGGDGNDVILANTNGGVNQGNYSAWDHMVDPYPAMPTWSSGATYNYCMTQALDHDDPGWHKNWLIKKDANDRLYLIDFQDGSLAHPVGTSTAVIATPEDPAIGDIVNAGEGRDFVWGGLGSDTLLGEGDGDYLYGLGGADVLEGGDGDDTIQGDINPAPAIMDLGLDKLHPGEHLLGENPYQSHIAGEVQGSDVIDGGAGNDTLMADGGGDTVYGGAGNDHIWGDNVEANLGGAYHGDDYLDGEDGDDTLTGGGKDDVLWGGKGDDVLSGDDSQTNLAGALDGSDELYGEDGNDQLTGGGKDDTLFGGAGNDTMWGDGEKDYLTGDFHGSDYLDGGDGDDYMEGGGGNDTLYGGAGNDLMHGDEIAANLPASYHGSDYLDGGDGDDQLDGNGGNDTLIGGNGNDRLFGGTGADYMDGGAGRDYYQVDNVGDVIVETDNVGGASAPMGLASLSALSESRVSGAQTELDGIAADDIDSVAASFSYTLGSNLEILILTGTEIIDGTGNELDNGLFGNSAANVLSGGSGADFLDAKEGDDTLLGGSGSDTLIGGAGDDTYVFNMGDGQDVIDNTDFLSDNTNPGRTRAWDVLRFGAGIDSSNLYAYRAGNDLVLKVRDSADQVTVANYYASDLFDGTVTQDHKIDGVWLSNGWFISQTAIQSMVDQAASNLPPMLVGSMPDLSAHAGNTFHYTLPDGLFSDPEHGALTYKIVMQDGSPLPAWLSFDASTRTLVASPGADLQGSSLSLSVRATDRFDASTSVGFGISVGGADTAPYLRTPLLDQAGMQGAALYYKVPVMAFVDPDMGDMLSYSATLADGSALPAWLTFTPQTREFTGTPPGLGTISVRVVAKDGCDLSVDDVFDIGVTPLVLDGTRGNDALSGTAAGDTIKGFGGDDQLSGYDGGDTLAGGSGRDTLSGGAGDDVYVVALGDQQDVIVESAGADTLRLGSGVAPAQVMLSRVSAPPPNFVNPYGPYATAMGTDSLVISLGVGQAQVWVPGFFDGTGKQIEFIEFTDGGARWNAADINARLVNLSGVANAQSGTAGNDTFTVDNAQDTVTEAANAGTDTVNSSVSFRLPDNLENLTLTDHANAAALGNDLGNTLTGNDADNVLNGMVGTDTLVGGKGDDLYVVTADQPYYGWWSGVGWRGDSMVEQAGEGQDTVLTNYFRVTLPDNVENLMVGPVGDLQSAFASNVSLQTSLYSYGRGFTDQRAWYVGNGLNNVMDATNQGSSRGVSAACSMSPVWEGVLLDGGAGADTLIGGDESTWYVVDNLGDIVIENGVPGYLDVLSSSTISLTAVTNVEVLELKGDLALSATGDAGANDLRGSMNSAANTLTGLDGDDWYWVGLNDVVVEAAGGGVDTVVIDLSAAGAAAQQSNGKTFSLADYANVENLAANGYSGEAPGGANEGVHIVGTAGNNKLLGSFHNDWLEGGAGEDWIEDGLVPERQQGYTTYAADTDQLFGGDGNDHLISYAGNDLLDGGAGDDVLLAYWGSSTMAGGAGDDTLTGGAGDDGLDGGLGNDVIVFGRGDGHDTMREALADNAPDKLNVLRFRVGITADSVIVRRWGNDLSIGIKGDHDWMTVQAFFTGESAVNANNPLQRIEFDDGTVWNLAKIVELAQAHPDHAPTLNQPFADQALAYNSSITFALPPESFSDVDADDELRYTATLADGGALPSWISFRSDDLSFSGTASSLGSISVKVTATDQTGASVSDVFDIVVSIPNLNITGTPDADYLEGGDGNDTLSGLAGNDTMLAGGGNDMLDGGAGGDTMWGGLGDDTYVVDSASDIVTEKASEGVDTVQTSISYTLTANVENLTLTGSAAINGTGNSLANTLTGNSGANLLDGGTGADTMVGGAGNDSYVVDNVLDVVTEGAGGGTDSVSAKVSYTLGAEVENLTLTGTSAINATGNALANVLTGNSGANVLDGAAGADTMIGGAGNDSYVVDDAFDVVTEAASAGTDLVRAGISYTLGANLENLTLTGTGNLNATGNSAANVLTGNAGDNPLNGGTGTDTMVGGAGNDTYVLDVAADIVTEAASAGTDTVQIGVTYTLGANVENLTLTGTSAVSGTGNTLANVLTGNSANNTLTGAAGNDTLDGGAGVDTLIGGTGNDIYKLGRGYGADSIQENDATAGNTDVLQCLSGIATDQLWFRHVGNNLEVSVIGTSDKATLTNWYLGSQYHVDQFKTSDGKTLLDSKVNALVDAMAAFSPPAAGQTTLPAAYQTALNPVIAANWQ